MTNKQLAEFLHAVFCDKSHNVPMEMVLSDEIQEGLCPWYVEGHLDKTWEQTTHKKWANHAFRWEEICQNNKWNSSKILNIVVEWRKIKLEVFQHMEIVDLIKEFK